MNFLRPLLMATLGSLLLLVAACETAIPAGPSPSGEQVVQQQAVSAYTLGNGDQLRITIFGQPDLSGQFEVDGTGSISMPLIGQVEALGLTTPELESRIVEKLEGDYVLNPRVSAEVINYRPYYILGEVNRPGEYPYNSGLTVVNAVAAAGGWTYRARKNVVYIKSVNSNEEQAIELTTSTVVSPGDTIRIGERRF
nr:polysaccharide biosynthesis/export family protein [uncultured Hyphomonas sp.]